MNATDRLPSELSAWFLDTATPMTDDDIDLIVQRTAGMRQRPRWTFLERWIPMRADALPAPSRSPSIRNLAILAALLILAAAIAVVAVGNRPTQPVYESIASNGLLAYAVDGDVVVVDPDTGETSTLVAGPESDNSPVFSPDGSQIAFVRTLGDDDGLFVVPAGGGTPVQLTTESVDVVGPAWSPDGSAIAFTNGDLVVAQTDGSGMRILPMESGAQYARFRPPDGAQIMFSNSLDNVSLFLVDQDGSDLVSIAYPDGRIVNDKALGWTPDGERLVVVRPVTPGDASAPAETRLLTVEADGTVTGDDVIGPRVAGIPFGVSISPEGERVVVPAAEGDDPGAWRAAIVPLDGVTAPILTGPVFTSADSQLEWSPDGTMIVARSDAAGETWLLEADGSGPGQQAPWHDPSGEPLVWQRLAP